MIIILTLLGVKTTHLCLLKYLTSTQGQSGDVHPIGEPRGITRIWPWLPVPHKLILFRCTNPSPQILFRVIQSLVNDYDHSSQICSLTLPVLHSTI